MKRPQRRSEGQEKKGGGQTGPFWGGNVCRGGKGILELQFKMTGRVRKTQKERVRDYKKRAHRPNTPRRSSLIVLPYQWGGGLADTMGRMEREEGQEKDRSSEKGGLFTSVGGGGE